MVQLLALAAPPLSRVGSTELVEMSLVVTSFCFLLPAAYASWAGHWFHAVMFAVMTIICTIYHVCDARAYLHEPSCNIPYLTYADHVWAYYCFMQMCFLIFGVEDQRVHAALYEADTKTEAIQPRMEKMNGRRSYLPRDVLVSRIISAFGVVWFPHCFKSLGDFTFHMMLIWIGLMIIVPITFWLQKERRSFASIAFLRANFWMRLLTAGILPIFCCTVLFIGAQSAGNGRVVHSVWHVMDALLAVNLQRTVLTQRHDPVYMLLKNLFGTTGPSMDILSTAPTNPVVAHWLLGLALCALLYMTGMFAYLKFLFGLQVTTTHAAAGAARLPYLPVLGLDTLKRPAGFIMEICWIVVLLSFVVTFAMVDFGLRRSKSSEKDHLLSRIGSTMIYSGIFLGAISALTVMARTTLLRVLPIAAGCGVAIVGICLMTCISTSGARPAVLARALIALALCVAFMCLLLMLLAVYRAGGMDYDGELFHSACPVLFTGLAGCEYVVLVLIAVWPLTFIQEIREHSEMSKIALPTKQRIDAFIMPKRKSKVLRT
mmetsp:Transcript_32886/g.59808  ORF Transcript_32886/g.59808 Transcript_32886/m.59808 type:complete len:544 (+) Transcript_32886:69-1700(+)